MKEVTGEKTYPGRGRRIKPAAKQFDAEGVKLVSKNPFKFGTRVYGLFSAFLGKARRVATVEQMVESYWKMQDQAGVPRDPIEAVLRDFQNYISAGQNPARRDLHLVLRRVDGEGRIARGETLKAKYELIGFKPSSSVAEKARELGWAVIE